MGEALSYQTSFISINGAIGFVFKFIHPFTSNDISMSRRWDKLSGIILEKSSVFILHGKNPMLIFGSLCEGNGFNNFMNHEQ